MVLEDITVRYNVIRHAGGGVNIAGEDSNNPSGLTKRVRVADNLFYDVDSDRWGGTGAFVLIGDGPRDIIIEHNTVSQNGNIVTAYGGSRTEPQTMPGFVFRDNLARHNQFGVIGDNRGLGLSTLDAYFPDAVFQSNAIAGGDAGRYPKGNTFVGWGSSMRLSLMRRRATIA